LLIEQAKGQDETCIDLVEEALRHKWAKVWIGQNRGQFNGSYSQTDPEILVPAWIDSWDIAKKAPIEKLRRNSVNRIREARAILGVRLQGPNITRLEVFGAWLDKNGHVQPPLPEKRNRSRHIHEFGFA
jgi:hypothetical protein